jgi:hypothetical protein
MWKSSVVLLTLAAALGGCAAVNTVESDVSTYSQWPVGRKPASFAFERLPSQQARPQEQDQLEASARQALASAGFQEVSDTKAADVTVQVAARVNRADASPWDDPFWWRGGVYYSRYGRGPYWGPWGGPWGPGGIRYDQPRYDREVAVLIRDAKSNQPLFEARATSDGLSSGSYPLLGAMFQAAMKDFPQNGINPRRVSVQLPAS